MKRVDLFKTLPEAYKTFLSLENYVNSTELTPIHKELIKIRASQLNGCAFCLDMHNRDARKLGETEQRLYTISAWRDTPFFDEKEQAILAFVEEVTLISKGGVSEATYANAAEVLGEKYVAQVLVAVIAINSWNRIAISTHMQPALQK
ncbi:carboxymuconolactone decarboxylase family protein [Mucilaginibacter achroorhodeus]|uniref:Carboxymuconolactone decarboxylase family protein n=1 Tax=Mucilaginibacter achroorhodeus TaxID=2599294 RepID=A0A563U7B9_9SPHI|nr:carboxymuconolactone decarboxylase family protein [Mucilaginibacter achroorhodeus]TWR27261.1 carboxymuconolactone decarboxylase family protein [Mucilaginibacter achroorhodeus]